DESMESYKLQEAAQVADVHKDTLRKMAAQRKVPGTKIGRSWIFPKHLFDRWIEERCLSTEEKVAPTGGSESQSLASRLAKRREQMIGKQRRSSSTESESGDGDSMSSATARQSGGAR